MYSFGLYFLTFFVYGGTSRIPVKWLVILGILVLILLRCDERMAADLNLWTPRTRLYYYVVSCHNMEYSRSAYVQPAQVARSRLEPFSTVKTNLWWTHQIIGIEWTLYLVDFDNLSAWVLRTYKSWQFIFFFWLLALFVLLFLSSFLFSFSPHLLHILLVFDLFWNIPRNNPRILFLTTWQYGLSELP